AEDGIRDRNVTGVQTCALPIWSAGGVDGGGRTPSAQDRQVDEDQLDACARDDRAPGLGGHPEEVQPQGDVPNPAVGLGPGQTLPGLGSTGRGGDGKTEGHLVCGGGDPGNEHVGEGDMGGRGVAHVTKLPCSRYLNNRAYVRGTHTPRGVRPASDRAL